MQPRFEQLEEKTLIGMSMEMSIQANATFKLFSTFMPRRKEIAHVKGTKVFDLRVYPPGYFLDFKPDVFFTKWALVEVAQVEAIPSGMEAFALTAGQYAVFTHIGLSTDNSPFLYIFTHWLPNADYVLDDRPHFEVLGEHSSAGDPLAEQEIWVPVRCR